jgi:hypothetical protein
MACVETPYARLYADIFKSVNSDPSRCYSMCSYLNHRGVSYKCDVRITRSKIEIDVSFETMNAKSYRGPSKERTVEYLTEAVHEMSLKIFALYEIVPEVSSFDIKNGKAKRYVINRETDGQYQRAIELSYRLMEEISSSLPRVVFLDDVRLPRLTDISFSWS